ncbi:hypothetical protein LTR50_004539 [Elasticomyces elasticus]|nr:hypothetical protein LTR50_004539 [Elasticomyces elasticus]
MPPAVKTQAELQSQKKARFPVTRTYRGVANVVFQLANSYSALLEEFSSKELHTVGNYTVGRLIGKGSFGKVYLASHNLTNGSKVVLKSAKKDDTNLAREIHHHRQFLHPHIARLYEVIVTESLVWLVLEYCPGDELYNHLLEHGRMEPVNVQRIFTQLVGAVSYVHNKFCVHRDLKLENILLDKNGNVKLVDFGFTREYQGAASYLQTWCGTVCYSAPEMLKGEKYAGEKVDVWSLGIILYALLCGELPFDEDDDAATKARILKEEPKYPEQMHEGAKALISQLLSKRPFLRPNLSDILKNPWLADHAPQQQEILKVQQPPPFTTQLEKDTLQRMRSAGVDIDMVIENVLSQRCDSLAGWWALLIEKEERKEKRRQRKRREREADAKSLRRLSAASGHLLSMSLKEINEEEQSTSLVSGVPNARGRSAARMNSMAPMPESSQPPETQPSVPELSAPHFSRENGARRSSSSRTRPLPPPKDTRRPRNASRGSSSMLHVVANNPDLLGPTGFVPKRKRRYQQPILDQLASLKHWFKESAKRTKSPNASKKSDSLSPKFSVGQQLPTPNYDMRRTSTGTLLQRSYQDNSSHRRPDLQSRATFPSRPRISTMSSNGSQQSNGRAHSKRPSLSPSPLTPHSSYRRSSAGLRGRKSTSSSVSSVRSIHQHHHSHSKASSTSSASVASPGHRSSTSRSRLSGIGARSPQSSVKVLPSTPTTSSFPSNIRVARRPPPSDLRSLPRFDDTRAAFGAGLISGAFGPPSPGLHSVFARRKRSVFKGPTLSIVGSNPNGPARVGSTDTSRSGSVPRRRSGELAIQEEDEEEDLELGDDEEDIEEVDTFSPIEGVNVFVEEFREVLVPEPAYEEQRAAKIAGGLVTLERMRREEEERAAANTG